MLDVLFVIVTAAVAYHGITYRTAEGDRDTVRLLFGCIALMFCIWVLFNDVIGINLR
ncbi:MAG: hypothetical protein WED00_18520 [Aquisalimonadaceae bacterium]